MGSFVSLLLPEKLLNYLHLSKSLNLKTEDTQYLGGQGMTGFVFCLEWLCSGHICSTHLQQLIIFVATAKYTHSYF